MPQRCAASSRTRNAHSTHLYRETVTGLAAPSRDGRFGEFGGQYVPETLVPACQELERAFHEAWSDPSFRG
ncbi:MAG: tryptophan synthase subunit beta, partial [Actinomycetota bacterium]